MTDVGRSSSRTQLWAGAIVLIAAAGLCLIAVTWGPHWFEPRRYDPPPEPPPPVVEPGPLLFEMRQHDFGRQWPGDPLTHRFPFVVSDEGPITVDRITRSCACIEGTIWLIDDDVEAPYVEGTVMSPGQRGVVIGGLETSRPTAKESSRLRLWTNHTDAPVVELRLRVTFEPMFEVDPPKLVAREILRSQGVVKSAMIRPLDDGWIEVERVRPLPDGWTVEVPTGSRLPSVELHVHARPAADAEHVSGYVVLDVRTSMVPGVRSIHLPVYGGVLPPVTVTPRHLIFDRRTAGREQTLTVTLEAPDPSATLRLNDVRATGVDAGSILFEEREGASPNVVLLDVLLQPSLPSGSLRARIEIDTNLRDEPLILRLAGLLDEATPDQE